MICSSFNLFNSRISSKRCKNKAYDPATDEARFYLKNLEVDYYEDKYEVVVDADACVLVTEVEEFRSPDFEKIKSLMNGDLFVDGRNQYSHDDMDRYGFVYKQIGVR